MNTMLTSAEVMELVNAEYSLGHAGNCRLIRRGYNDHYLVGIGTNWYVLRVYLNHKNYIESPDAFRFELDLLKHLASAGLPVSEAVPGSRGDLLGWVDTELGARAFALFTYVSGDQVNRRTATAERCFLLGQTAARIHIAANSFRSEYRRYHLDRTFLVDEPLRIIAQQHDETLRVVSESEVKGLEELVESLQPIEELLSTVESLGTSGDEFGIIHSDLHPGNIHFDGDQISVFDFDHCAFGWRAYELSLTEFMPESQKEPMLKGYESVRPLSQDERACIPVFAKLRRLWDVGDSLAIESVQRQSA